MTADRELHAPDRLPRFAPTGSFRSILAAGIAGGGAAALTHLPGFDLYVLAQGAARIAGLLSGSPIVPTDAGFALPTATSPVIITTACSASDFCWMVAAMIAWRLACAGRRGGIAIVAGIASALPVAIVVNALRITIVAQAHRWVIPRFPESYGHFLHLTTGVAVFLPALVVLNLALEYYARHRSCSGC